MRLFDDDDDDDDDDGMTQIDPNGVSKEKPKPRKGDPDLSIIRETRTPPPEPNLDRIFGSEIAQLIRGEAINKKGAPDFVMAGLLWGASTAIGNSMKVVMNDTGWSQPATMWCMVIGSPSAKKTPAISPFEAALNQIEAEHMAVWRVAYERWEEEKEIAEGVLKKWKATVIAARSEGNDAPARPAGTDVPPMPPEPKLVTNSATIEALFRLHVRQPRGLGTFRQEIGQWFDDMDCYSSSSDRGNHLESYDAGPSKSDRVKENGKTIHVKRFNQPILGGIQPDRLLDITSRKNADDGLVPRFLGFWPEFKHVDAHASAKDRSSDIRRILKRLFEDVQMEKGDDGPKPLMVPLSKGASYRVKDWINEKIAREAKGSIRLQARVRQG